MINYLALLGWGYDETTTFFTIPELQELFSLERVSKNPAVFDEQKLRWINGRYVRELPVEDLTARLEEFTGRTGLQDAVAITQEKISTLDEFWPLAGSFFDGPVDDPKAREKFLEHAGVTRGARGRPGGPGRPARAVDQAETSRRRCAESSSAPGASRSRSSSLYGSL